MKMKLQLALVTLAFFHSCAARGLKAPRSAEATTTVNEQLQAENEALRKKNKHLEAMMQVARNEVHKMDLADKLPKDAEHLRRKLQAVEADKKSLVQTLRQMLARNSTKIFQKQAENTAKAKQALETKCSSEQAAFEAKMKEATGKTEEAIEMVQTLQEQNMDLQKKVHTMRDQLSKTDQQGQELAGDKANLVETMHALMRENTRFKKELGTAAQKEKNTTQELAKDEAMLTKLAKKMKMPKAAAEKNLRKAPPATTPSSKKTASKYAPLHLNHQESMAAKIAKMNRINRYIEHSANVDVPADDNSGNVIEQAVEAAVVTPKPAQPLSDWASVTQQVDTLEKQEDVLARKRQLTRASSSKDVTKMADTTSKGLSGWLGVKEAAASEAEGNVPKDANGLSPIDALDPEAVKQEKAVQAKQAAADADDGGDGIAGLLSQAKDQLSAMDKAEAQTSD